MLYQPSIQLKIALWAAMAVGGVLPTVGSKELVALLPSLFGIGPGDTVAIPDLAYPTYAVGAELAGANALTYGGLLELYRKGEITWEQGEPFGPIQVRRTAA